MSDDLISRQRVLFTLTREINLNLSDAQYDRMVKAINSVPSEQEWKEGKWIVDEDGNIECSVCGHHGVGDLYCERCGAKMDEKERGWKK